MCPKCGKDNRMSRDHIVPRWLLRRIGQFGLNKLKQNRLVPELVFQKICVVCNYEKGGKIDYDNPIVNDFMLKFAHAILEKCKSKSN